MTILISEIGNCHFGDFSRAKELIKASIESGADIVKGQAFYYADIAGSMPVDFYKKCQFNLWQLVELRDYARGLGREMFFSIFSREYEPLKSMQKYEKLAAPQTKTMFAKDLENYDRSTCIISMNMDRDLWPRLSNAYALYASSYCAENPELENLKLFAEKYPHFGYSDHTTDINNCINAVKEYGAQVVETHFCMKKNESFSGVIFRDTVHGKTPKEFYKISRAINWES